MTKPKPTAKPRETRCGARILEQLARQPSTAPQLSRDLGIGPNTAYAAIKALAQRKRIECVFRGVVKGTRGRITFVWALPGTQITPAILALVEQPIEVELARERLPNLVKRAIAAQPMLATVWNFRRGEWPA